jgi:hypothetical protein
MFEITLERFLEMYKLKAVGIKNLQKHNLKLPLELDVRLAEIVAYLTFDGHLSLRQHCFLYTGKNKSLITPFRELIKGLFNIDGILRFKNDGSFGPSCEFRVFNNPLTKLLYLAGTPSGNKTLQEFSVPEWILKSKEFSRCYLKVAFDCEGSIWKARDGRIGINFTIAKEETILSDGINFMKTLQDSLFYYFHIKSGKIIVINGNKRKDGKTTKFLRFNIITDSLKVFKQEIGFINIVKNRKLREYIN